MQVNINRVVTKERDFVNPISKIKYLKQKIRKDNYYPVIEYCTRCGAALDFQKGFDSDSKYWECKGCGMLLYNPDSGIDDGITWFCDNCKAVISDQEGFDNACDEWKCKECGYVNQINESEVYSSEDEFQRAFNSPFRGLSNDDAIKLMMYEDIESIEDREDVVRVRNLDDNCIYVKKYLRTYDESIYRFLKNHPVNKIPQIKDLFLTDNCLIVIEENISGRTLEDVLSTGPIEQDSAIKLIKELCLILMDLHNLEKPIIHRDIKPSNIMITDNNEVYLLDVNVAKWNKEEIEDTTLLGTQHYAAPEQYGFGYSASSNKTDIYPMMHR